MLSSGLRSPRAVQVKHRHYASICSFALNSGYKHGAGEEDRRDGAKVRQQIWSHHWPDSEIFEIACSSWQQDRFPDKWQLDSCAGMRNQWKAGLPSPTFLVALPFIIHLSRSWPTPLPYFAALIAAARVSMTSNALNAIAATGSSTVRPATQRMCSVYIKAQSRKWLSRSPAGVINHCLANRVPSCGMLLAQPQFTSNAQSLDGSGVSSQLTLTKPMLSVKLWPIFRW